MNLNNVKNYANKFGQILLKISCFSFSVFLFYFLFAVLPVVQDLGWFIIIEKLPILFLLLYAALKLLEWAGVSILSFIYKKFINYFWIIFILLAIFYTFLAFYQYYYDSDVFKNNWRIFFSILYVPFFVTVAIYNFKLKKSVRRKGTFPVN